MTGSCRRRGAASFRRVSLRALPLVALTALSCASASSEPRTPLLAPLSLVLAPCKLPDVPRPAKCGTATVLEDRALGTGRRVPLKVVVVPAAKTPAAPDPVVFIVGGPGEIATEEVGVVEELPQVAATHDFVFVDQRGMGRDSPLRCKLVDGTDVGGLPSGELSEPKLKACLASMDANPALYTTSIAADDLDEVLGALGYAQANVMGGSYGSFAAQAVAHAHPGRVRTLILNGVVPPRDAFVLGFAPNAQAALEQTFAECAADAACHTMYPDPKRELSQAFARLDAHPEPLVAEGLAGEKYPVTLDRRAFAMALRRPLYNAAVRGLALRMIHDVATGRFQTMAGPILAAGLSIGRELSIGGYLSIACAESLAGVTLADAERTSAGTFLGTARSAPILDACRFWPTGKDPAWLHEPLSGDLPALMFGGTRDPATPLVGLEQAKAKLRNAQAVVVPGAGHGVGGRCTDTILSAFLANPLAKVDAGCVKPIVSRFDPLPVKLTAEELDRCTGRFAFSPTFAITVWREGDALTSQATGQGKNPLEAASATRFRVPYAGADVDFEMGPDGRARRMVVHQGGSDEVGERAP